MSARHHDQRSAVIAFPPRAKGPQQSPRNAPAEVIDFATYRRALENEQRDAIWDRLEELGRAAWTWRDPESIEALEAWVAQLRMSIRAEWESA
jgi:hypothetical protein